MTVTSASAKPVGASVKVKVKRVVSPDSKVDAPDVITKVGGVASTEMSMLSPVPELPTPSLNAPSAMAIVVVTVVEVGGV